MLIKPRAKEQMIGHTKPKRDDTEAVHKRVHFTSQIIREFESQKVSDDAEGKPLASTRAGSSVKRTSEMTFCHPCTGGKDENYVTSMCLVCSGQ